MFFEKQEVKLILTIKKLLISNINTTFKKLEYNDIDSNDLKFTYKKNSNPDRYDIAKLCIRDTKKNKFQIKFQSESSFKDLKKKQLK